MYAGRIELNAQKILLNYMSLHNNIHIIYKQIHVYIYVTCRCSCCMSSIWQKYGNKRTLSPDFAVLKAFLWYFQKRRTQLSAWVWELQTGFDMCIIHIYISVYAFCLQSFIWIHQRQSVNVCGVFKYRELQMLSGLTQHAMVINHNSDDRKNIVKMFVE